MGKYVVAIFNHLEGVNRTFLVTAANQNDAAKEAILAHCSPKYRDAQYKEWVASLGDNIETIATGAAQGELVIYTPFEINSLLTLSKAQCHD